MTSAPERAVERALEVVSSPRLAGAGTAGGSRWLRRLGRRLWVLDSTLVALTLTAVLVVRFTALSAPFGRERSRIAFPESFDDVRLSSYLIVGPLLVLAWCAMLGATRAYDARVLGVGSEEYRRVARASVYFWGLVIAAVATLLYVLRRSRLL